MAHCSLSQISYTAVWGTTVRDGLLLYRTMYYKNTFRALPWETVHTVWCVHIIWQRSQSMPRCCSYITTNIHFFVKSRLMYLYSLSDMDFSSFLTGLNEQLSAFTAFTDWIDHINYWLKGQGCNMFNILLTCRMAILCVCVMTEITSHNHERVFPTWQPMKSQKQRFKARQKTDPVNNLKVESAVQMHLHRELALTPNPCCL